MHKVHLILFVLFVGQLNRRRWWSSHMDVK